MTFVSALANRGSRVAAHRPWPRVVVNADTWRQAVLGIAAGEATLLGLWSDGEAVHMALLAEGAPDLLVVSLACPERRFPSVGITHPPALRLERTIRDLYGLEPEGSPDARRWLDHGRWGVRQPLGRARARHRPPATPTPSLTAEGPPLHQIPVGPVHAGIIEPGHFRFTANGETVVRLEERLGYVHKGIDGLMIGAPLEKAAQARRPRLRRQHGRLRDRLRARRRGRARHRAAAARGLAARADGASWSASPITSATSAPSATTPRSR